MSRPPTSTTYSSLDSSEPAQTIDNCTTLWDILSTTALNRCWPVLICTGIWSSALCVLNHYTHGTLSIQPTLITVFGTVLGFVISFRTTSGFERYNDGRKFWSQIVLNCRIFSRTVWFHVPDNAISAPTNDHPLSDEEMEQDQAKTLIEKKTVVNLLEAYAVSVKHYLRGEDGIYYDDLYPLISFLSPCSYSLPAIIPPANPPELHRGLTHASTYSHCSHNVPASPGTTQVPESPYHLSGSNQVPLASIPEDILRPANQNMTSAKEGTINSIELLHNEEFIRPSAMRPMRSWRKAFPFSFFLWIWIIIKKDAGRAVGVNDPRRDFRSSKNNVPLEISLFLSSYISALQVRKTVDAPTISLLYTTLNQLVDALTGLERILTTPIPVSYSSHLWMVTLVYCTTLPFQLWSTLKWLTIPASIIASFMFFGFVVAGEEIESYDRNDLNLDHFVHNIIRKELRAITAMPTPDPAKWAFSPQNDFLGTLSRGTAPKETPSAWLHKGKTEILTALHGGGGTTGVAH
ncbi:Bestrophin, RFP-TM, chloride channel-domain-containing protein [Suillus ampliporus]|nr:Bestrophin, RFP-TM, chloride channel-domain-containing protein [Suillus ampliporus]